MVHVNDNGFSGEDLIRLIEAGVAGIDVAGAGGTKGAVLEGLRAERAGAVAAAFADWGYPTADVIRTAREAIDAAAAETTLIGSGGIADGVDAMKALCLGADLAAVARGVLHAADKGADAAVAAVDTLVRQLRIAVWSTGVTHAEKLGQRL